jgi:hypothetical protein
MIGTKLHKWLFSLTLIISLVSFSEIGQKQINPAHTITQVFASNNDSSRVYYLDFTKQESIFKKLNHINFYFKSFINAQNNLYSQNENIQNLVVFSMKDDSNTIHQKLVSITEDKAHPTIG